MAQIEHSARTILEALACERPSCPCHKALRVGKGNSHCPVHHDVSPSFGVKEAGGQVLVYCYAGCDQPIVIDTLRHRGLWPIHDVPKATIIAEYDYFDANGTFLYQTARFAPKDFRQRRPNGPGKWTWKLDDVPRVLYRLPELRAAPPGSTVHVVEGEGLVERLRGLGLIATCNVGGAGKWRSEYAAELRGFHVKVHEDNDEPGRKHARAIAESLTRTAASVQIVSYPELAEGGDVGDWLDDGHDLVDLEVRMLTSAPASEPWPEPEDRGYAVLSKQGDVQYVEDLARPGRITTWAAEEGAGKSYTVAGELGIRVAVAGGRLAETWPIVQRGGVLVLSEMHTDDDYEREATVLRSLELNRSNLIGRYWRLGLMTAADGKPCLREPDWRAWCVRWCREHGIVMMIVDTATGATDVDPWGREIQAVYRDLRTMLEEYPELAIVLVVHCKKPQGHTDKRITDVLGEWGRWCDVVVLQERDGMHRAKLTTYKRVRHMRRIVATQQDGLLIDAKDIAEPSAPKVPLDVVVDTIVNDPGLTVAQLAERLKVSKPTANRYVKTAVAAGLIRELSTAQRNTTVLYPETTASPLHTASQSDESVPVAPDASPPLHRFTTYIGEAVGDAVQSPLREWSS